MQLIKSLKVQPMEADDGNPSFNLGIWQLDAAQEADALCSRRARRLLQKQTPNADSIRISLVVEDRVLSSVVLSRKG